MDTPTISIIIPCYQKAPRLKSCLDSVLKQSLAGIEVICVNDGSTDETQDILDKYAHKNSIVRVFHQENKGVSAARNFAIEQARGEFIAFMDADDEYPEVGTLEYFYNKAKENNVDIAGGNVIYCHEGHLDVGCRETELPYVFKNDGVMAYSDYQYDYGFWRYIYKRQMLIEHQISFPAIRCYEDPVFFAKAMHVAKSFYASTKLSYVYYSESGRVLSRASRVDMLRGILMLMEFARQHQYEGLRALAQVRFYEEQHFHEMHQYNKAGDVEMISCFLAVAAEIDRYPLPKDEQAEIAQYILPHKRLARGVLLHTLKRMISFRGSLRDSFRILCMLTHYIVAYILR